MLKDRIALYCQGLNGLTEIRLQFAFERALENLGEYLPSIQQIREYASEWQPPIPDSQHILARPDKPPDWPEDLAEREALIEEGRERLAKVLSEVEQLANKRNISRGYIPSEDSDFEAKRRRQLEAHRRSGGL